MKPKLLIVELWGIGDLAIATPFLRAASEKFDVTLLAKPHALELQQHFWPQTRIMTFNAPWTAFKNKYRLWQWPWKEIFQLQKQLRAEHFDVGLSARWDPRDHLLLKFSGAKKRVGFPRLASGIFLTCPLAHPDPLAHRYEFWRSAGEALGIDLPPREKIPFPAANRRETILIHTGAGQPIRVWPLENYKKLAARLREKNFQVQIVCDAAQREWWLRAGEKNIATPANISELIALTNRAAAFIGNDSGPGHLAAISGIPTFTFFGSQLPEWFAPLHPQSEWLDDKSCPYKPCKDYCHFSSPRCLENIEMEAAWIAVKKFAETNLVERTSG